MTKAQAVTVAGDLVNAGYDAHAHPIDAAGSQWQVEAASFSGPVDCATIQTFATAHSVVARAQQATFS